MEQTESVLSETTDDGITVLTLNEPERRNPLSPAVVNGLTSELREKEQDPACRVVVLVGAGRGFCAGADLSRMGDTTIVRDRADYENVLVLNRLVWSYPKPTVAAVHGFALGGGCNLMGWCDFAVAERDTRLGFPEIRSGMPAGAVIPMLQRTVGRRAMLEIALLGQDIDVDVAEKVGLINRAVGPGDAFIEAMRIAGALAAHDPAAVRFTKETITGVAEMDYERGVSYARDLRVIARADPDFTLQMGKPSDGSARGA